MAYLDWVLLGGRCTAAEVISGRGRRPKCSTEHACRCVQLGPLLLLFLLQVTVHVSRFGKLLAVPTQNCKSNKPRQAPQPSRLFFSRRGCQCKASRVGHLSAHE